MKKVVFKHSVSLAALLSIQIGSGIASYHTENDFNSCKARLETVQPGDISALIKTATASRGTVGKNERSEAIKKLDLIKNALDKVKNSPSFDPNRKGGFSTRLKYIEKDLSPFDFSRVDRSKLHSSSSSIVPNLPFKTDTTTLYDCSNASARKKIFDQNQQISKNGYMINGKLIKVDTEKLVKESYVVENTSSAAQSLINKRGVFKTTSISVVNKDCLDHAIEMQDKAGLNPLVLDMANATLPGGAAKSGKGNVQEEVIVYRSNLFAPLNCLRETREKQGLLEYGDLQKGGGNFIPQEGGVYLPNVTIFREWHGIGSQKSYNFMANPKRVSLFAAAAYRHHSRKNSGQGFDAEVWSALKNEKTYWERTTNKIRSMFLTALKEGHDSLVLGAFGCGAFSNPPEKIIECFKTVIQEFSGYFKRIDFAVLCPQNNTKNFDLFRQAFEKKAFSQEVKSLFPSVVHFEEPTELEKLERELESLEIASEEYLGSSRKEIQEIGKEYLSQMQVVKDKIEKLKKSEKS